MSPKGEVTDPIAIHAQTPNRNHDLPSSPITSNVVISHAPHNPGYRNLMSTPATDRDEPRSQKAGKILSKERFKAG